MTFHDLLLVSNETAKLAFSVSTKVMESCCLPFHYAMFPFLPNLIIYLWLLKLAIARNVGACDTAAEKTWSFPDTPASSRNLHVKLIVPSSTRNSLICRSVSLKYLIIKWRKGLVLTNSRRSAKSVSGYCLWFLNCTTSACRWGSRDGKFLQTKQASSLHK